MARHIAVSEFKAHCLRLLDDVAKRRLEIVLTKRGRPIARVGPIGRGELPDAVGRLRGTLIGGESLSDFATGAKWEADRR